LLKAYSKLVALLAESSILTAHGSESRQRFARLQLALGLEYRLLMRGKEG
jgi:hypothetical protein